MRTAKKTLLGLVAAMLGTLAYASVAGACMWLYYQPPVPKSLEK